MKKVLLLEDDQSLGETLFNRLSKDYEVHWAKDIASAWKFSSQLKDLDVAILDLGLPDGNGFDFASKLKATNKNVPFIFLTAQAGPEERLKGFELGAEEFIPKPFHLKELLIRLEHVLEKHSPLKLITLKKCTINFSDMSIQNSLESIEYPPLTDMKILQLLVQRAPKVLSRDEIMNEIWGVDKMPSHRTIDNIIVRLRQIIGENGENYIRSIRGIGYQWNQEEKDTI